MTLTFTPISQLDLITTLENSDTLLLLDASTANQAGRVTLEILANYLALTATQIDWVNILNKPVTFPPATHSHTKDQITDLSLGWVDILDKPATFPPSGHTHTTTDITGLNSAIDARLTNLPNGVIIGGVAHFFQDTPPATRIGGDPLQIKDRCQLAKDSIFWNGALWLSTTLYSGGGQGTNIASNSNLPTGNNNFSSIPLGYRIFAESLNIRYLCSSLSDANFWNLGVRVWADGTTTAYTLAVKNTALAYTTANFPLNQIVPNTFFNYSITGFCEKIGTPANISFSVSLHYRLVF